MMLMSILPFSELPVALQADGDCTTNAWSKVTLASGRFLAPQHETRRRRLRNQAAIFIGHVALDVADGSTSLHDLGLGFELGLPDRTKEIDFKLDRRERFAFRQRAHECRPHRGVGDVAQNSAMPGPERIGMLRSGLE